MRLRIGSPSTAARRRLPAALALLVAASLLTAPLPGQGTTVAETYREAYDNGYRDGSAVGRLDRHRGKSVELIDKPDFKKAENGFDPARHDREVYILAYRRGFEDGYQKGYGIASAEQGAQTAEAASEATPAPPSAGPVPASAPAAAPVRGGTLLPGATLRLQLLDSLSTKYNERGDPFRANVIEDVRQDGATLVPKGSKVNGAVSRLKRAGRIRGRAEISLRFDGLEFPDGRSVPLEAVVVAVESPGEETVRDGEGAIVAAPGRGDDAKKVGTATGVGGLIGVIAGGKGGAGAGAAAGAVAGLANVLISRGRDAHLESRTRLSIRLTQPLTIPPPTP